MAGTTVEDSDVTQNPLSDGDQRVYFVPYRWWKEAQDSLIGVLDAKEGTLYTASPASFYAGPMKIINSILFNSDPAFNLRREDCNGQSNGQNDLGVSGREFALVTGEMWLQALKWHSDSKVAVKNGRKFSAAEADMSDVYPLQLRLSVLRETDSLGVRISKKDNAVEFFRRACKIFNVESEVLRIWDFSGQTTLFLINDRNKLPKGSQKQPDQEILLELQVYGLSDLMKCREGRKDETTVQQDSNCGASLMMKGSSVNGFIRNGPTSCGSYSESGSLGLTGLQNLGNTCFMNSALQCLAHTPKLVDYFLGDYSSEINHENPLGMDGELALAFGDLLRKLWAPGATALPPRLFKSKLARFAPQFSGFSQHDSQELLAFLLDGLHEDLNRVKCKPYTEVKDGENRSDEEVADEYWRNHLARNDSIVVDVCQGQYKSTLVCPVCKKVSVTFDPFMYLSLPLPSRMTRSMTVTVVGTDGNSKPLPYTVTVPKNGKCVDLVQALSTACSLEVDETLLMVEIYNNHIIRYLEEPGDLLSLIRDGDRLVAYRLPKDIEKVPLILFMHQRLEEQYFCGKLTSSWKEFAIPLVTRLGDHNNGSEICELYLRLLNPFLLPAKSTVKNSDTIEDTATGETRNMEEAISTDAKGFDSHSDAELQFYLTDDKGSVKDSKILMNDPLKLTGLTKRLNVLVCWSDKKIKQYDISPLSSLPEIFKSSFFVKRSEESVSLYNCLEAFLKEEPLGPEDMWYCPVCKKHCQASKKLDLWRLPEILVIHLKRFSYSRFMKNKLETFVDFPITDLDLSTYIPHRKGQSSNCYMLYAASNHYGSMGGGHYTAFVRHGGDRWYDFDDSHVSPISGDKIKSSAAYVLFYRRTSDGLQTAE